MSDRSKNPAPISQAMYGAMLDDQIAAIRKAVLALVFRQQLVGEVYGK